MADTIPSLPKPVIVFWRDQSLDPNFRAGLDYLLRYYAPKAKRGGKVEEMMNDSIGFTYYLAALEDIEKVLTEFEPIAPENPSIEPLHR